MDECVLCTHYSLLLVWLINSGRLLHIYNYVFVRRKHALCKSCCFLQNTEISVFRHIVYTKHTNLGWSPRNYHVSSMLSSVQIRPIIVLIMSDIFVTEHYNIMLYQDLTFGVFFFFHIHCNIISFIFHQMFSLVHDWSKCITWLNIPQLKLGNIQVIFSRSQNHFCCGKYSKNN